MKLKNRFFVAGFVTLFLLWACAKTPTPTPPIHDTVTVHKTDTLIKTDTLHKTDTLFKPVDTPNLKIGLLLYLPFNGSMADSSGNANPTTPVAGASLTYDMHGYSNNAFGGTGSGERILVTNNGSIKFDTAFSISVDVMLNHAQQQNILTMVQSANGQGVSFGLAITGITNQFAWEVSKNNMTCSDIVGVSNSVSDTTPAVLQPGSWYNIVTIYHMGTMQTFVNGQLVSTKNGASATVPICPAAQIIVGGWWAGDPLSINGKLDEIRLFNRVLSSKEIAWLARNFQTTSTKLRPILQTK